MTRLETQGLGARPDLASVEPYVSPQLPARYRLNTNESPYPPPVGLIDEIAAAIREVALNRYPDRDATSLYSKLAQRTGTRPSPDSGSPTDPTKCSFTSSSPTAARGGR